MSFQTVNVCPCIGEFGSSCFFSKSYIAAYLYPASASMVSNWMTIMIRSGKFFLPNSGFEGMCDYVIFGLVYIPTATIWGWLMPLRVNKNLAGWPAWPALYWSGWDCNQDRVIIVLGLVFVLSTWCVPQDVKKLSDFQLWSPGWYV